MFGFKSSSKNKRKLLKHAAISTNSSNEPRVLYNIPSVSQIAPLPQNKSHGILPVLSLDGRDAPILMQSEMSETNLTLHTTTSTEETGRQPVGEYVKPFSNLQSLLFLLT
jgi:hypothetical protein